MMMKCYTGKKDESLAGGMYYIKTEEEILLIGNNKIELGFQTSLNGALVSILDKKTSTCLQRDEAAPKTLFRLALRYGESEELVWLDSRDAREFGWDVRESAAVREPGACDVQRAYGASCAAGEACAGGAHGAAREPDAGGEAVNVSTQLELVLKASSFPNNKELMVEVVITLTADSALSTWRMAVYGAGNAAVCRVTCPIISGVMKVGSPVSGETLVAPRYGEGMLFKDPYPVVDHLLLMAGDHPDMPRVGMGEINQMYPGDNAMQFLLYYNDQAGLYLATHDSGENVKSFNVGKIADWGMFPVMSITHHVPEVAGGDVHMDYQTIVGVFHGDCYDGTDIYKTWATKQWWCEKKLRDKDIPAWMRTGFGVFEMSNYHVPKIKLDHSVDQIADMVNNLSKEIGVPLLSLIFNWEGGGAWTGPIGQFPPREGEEKFKAAMYRLREAGNYGFVFIPGGTWYVKNTYYDPPFDSWPEHQAECENMAIKKVNGDVWFPPQAYKEWIAARLCPWKASVREQIISLVLGCIRLGCPVVQIDNFPACNPTPCYDKQDDHPKGHGPWWAQSFREMLADLRKRAKALDPDCALSVEGVSENFILHLDMYDHRSGDMEYHGHWYCGDPMGGETVPIFNYVYSEYIASYCTPFLECNRPEILYWTRSMGKSLAQGVVPTTGWYFPEPAELNPVTLSFFKRITRAAVHDCWDYFMFGEMLHPPEIKLPKISASYLRIPPDYDCMDVNSRHVVADDAVQYSVWRGNDGSIAYFFINISEEQVEFEVKLSAYGGESDKDNEDMKYKVDRVVDGCRETWLENVNLPVKQTIYIQPLSIIIIKVTKSVL